MGVGSSHGEPGAGALWGGALRWDQGWQDLPARRRARGGEGGVKRGWGVSGGLGVSGAYLQNRCPFREAHWFQIMYLFRFDLGYVAAPSPVAMSQN